jgi:hypothetical protein
MCLIGGWQEFCRLSPRRANELRTHFPQRGVHGRSSAQVDDSSRAGQDFVTFAHQSRYPRRTILRPTISKSKRAFRGVERTRSLLQKTCWDPEVHSAMLPPFG